HVVVAKNFGSDGRAPRRVELGLEEAHGPAQRLVQIHGFKLRRRHFGEVAEPADDRFEISQLFEQCGRALAENLIELLRRLLSGALHVLNRDLDREKRVLELVRQSSRQLAPGCDPLGLNETVALLEQLLRYTVEGP